MERWHLRSAGRLGAALSGAALISVMAASTALAGNNGTIKIHEMDTPEGTPSNDPKVCSFNVEVFGIDEGDGGWLVFTVQGGDAPTGTDYDAGWVGTADEDGDFVTGYFSLQPGHYKATLYGKEGHQDLKAKSKVFKVECKCPSEGGSEEGGDASTG